MAFGFPGYHEERVHFPDVSGRELMDALDEAFHRLGWGGHQTGRWSFRGSTGMVPFLTWGNTVIAEVEGDGELFVRRECAVPFQCFDWGVNSSNVNALLTKLERLLDAPARRRYGRD
jgi:hypothetical protein